VPGILTTSAGGFKSSGPIAAMLDPIQERDRCAAISTAHDVVGRVALRPDVFGHSIT